MQIRGTRRYRSQPIHPVPHPSHPYSLTSFRTDANQSHSRNTTQPRTHSHNTTQVLTSPAPKQLTVRQWKHLERCLIITQLLIISGLETNPGPSPTQLNMCHVNMNSITSNIDELQTFVTTNNTDLLMVSETKLDESVHPSLYELQGFHTRFLNNRNRDGGGTAIHARENILGDSKS